MSGDEGDAAPVPFDSGDSAGAIAGALREGIEAADVEELDVAGREELGRELGARAGRELGAVVGRSVGEMLARRLREGESASAGDVLAEIRTFVVDLLRSLLTSTDVRSALGDAREYVASVGPGDLADEASAAAADATEAAASGAEEVADGVQEVTDEVSDAAEEVVPGEESAEETAAEAEAEKAEVEAEAAEGEAEAAEGEATPEEAAGTGVEGAGVEADVSPEELSELREETLRELLDVMAYEDLQSVAKKVDVKGNLSRDEMTDRIIGAFADGESGDDGDDEPGE